MVEGIGIKPPAAAWWQKIFCKRAFATCMDAHVFFDAQDEINAKLSAAAYGPRMAKAPVCYEDKIPKQAFKMSQHLGG